MACCRAHASCSTARSNCHGTTSTAASSTASTRTARFYDEDKYFWVQAESLAAAALLADRMSTLGDAAAAQHYWNDTIDCGTYSWAHFVDHKYGAWYRILTRDNRKYSDEKSPAGKTDYHTMGACYEVLNVTR